MNKLLLILSLGLLNLQATTWHTLEEAQKLQKQNSKIIMLNITASHCPYCKKMEKNVFQNIEMSKWIDNKFIPVKVDIDFDDIPMNLNPKMTPTFYFISKEEKILKVIPGSWNIEDFKDLTRKIK